MIKAIETEYRGCLFRSRLEARWAVLFEKLGIAWEYEPEGFELDGGKGRYLPDFFLPGPGYYVEVKPRGATSEDTLKARWFSAMQSCPVLLAVGTPDIAAYWVHAGCFERDQEYVSWIQFPLFDQGVPQIPADIGCVNCDEVTPMPRQWLKRQAWEYLGAAPTSAIKAARSARFEFGRQG